MALEVVLSVDHIRCLLDTSVKMLGKKLDMKV